MMRTRYPVMLTMIVGFAIFVDGLQVAQAVLTDRKCLTMLQPQQCLAGGSTFCQAYLAANPGKCNGTAGCFWCDSSNGLTGDRCVYYEKQNCNDNGSPMTCPVADKWSGFCEVVNGICSCNAPTRTMKGCSAESVPTCTKP